MSSAKDKDYLFLSAMVRALEVSMVPSEAFVRMADAPSAAAAAAIAAEHGYADLPTDSPEALDRALSARLGGIYSELATLAPYSAALDLFRLRFDYHNTKVLVKAEALGKDESSMLSGAGRIPADELSGLLSGEDATPGAGRLKQAAEEARATLARTRNPQLADFILDRAYFADMAELSERCGELGAGYARLLADAANLSAYVRSARMNRSADFLAAALTEGGNASPDAYIELWPSADITALFSDSPLFGAAGMGQLAIEGGSAADFELARDNALIEYLSRSVYISFGSDVLTAYLARLDAELANLRTVISGKICFVPPERIKERLRGYNG